MNPERDPYEIRMLESEDVLFSRGPGGVFQGVVDGKPHDEIVVYRAFPFLHANRYISVRTPAGEEIGIIRDVKQLDEESRKEIERELQFRYFLPRVTRVCEVKEKTDLWVWDVETHLGPTRIVMRNLHDHMQFPDGRRIILTDISGKRCEIRDWRMLDLHSRKQLKDII